MRDGLLIQDQGWGEVSPFWGYDAVESASAGLAAAEQAARDGYPAALRRRSAFPLTPG